MYSDVYSLLVMCAYNLLAISEISWELYDDHFYSVLILQKWSRLHHYCTVLLDTVGATTVEKLEGTSSGVDADPLPFPPPSLPNSPTITPPLFHPFPSLHSSSHHLEITARRFEENLLDCPRCPAKNDSQLDMTKCTRST